MRITYGSLYIGDGTPPSSFELLGHSGLGACDIERKSQRAHNQIGDTDLGFIHLPRYFSIKVGMTSSTEAEFYAKRAELLAIMSPHLSYDWSNTMFIDVPLSNGTVKSYEIDAYPIGIEGMDTYRADFPDQEFNLQFKAPNPLIRSEYDRGLSITNNGTFNSLEIGTEPIKPIITFTGPSNKITITSRMVNRPDRYLEVINLTSTPMTIDFTRKPVFVDDWTKIGSASNLDEFCIYPKVGNTIPTLTVTGMNTGNLISVRTRAYYLGI